jgi:hypothetical protein
MLPAGLCFRPGYLSRFNGCSSSPHPVAAVIGVYATPELASAALRAVPRGRLPMGYPLAVHVDEVGLDWPEKGIALIAGLFADEARAQAWATAHAGVFDGVKLAKLLDARPGRAHPPFVIRIQAGGATAYDRRPIDRLLQKESMSNDEMRGTVTAQDMKALCRLPGDTLFTATYEDVSFHRAWAPVHCGGTPAYVRWTDTLLDTVIFANADGTGKLVQIIDVSCDEPTFGWWRYDEHGRHPLPGVPDARGGCRDDQEDDDNDP